MEAIFVVDFIDPNIRRLVLFFFFSYSGKQRRIAKYYTKQENLVKGFSEMEIIHRSGCAAGVPTEVYHLDINFFLYVYISSISGDI